MNIGIFGTGQVAKQLAGAWRQRGHAVMIGGRSAQREETRQWADAHDIRYGTFEETASFGQTLVNCTAGMHSLDALAQTNEDDMRDKVLLDVSNPLDFSRGFPPTLGIVNDDSLGERIQTRWPQLHVVKVLSTVANTVMVDPSIVPGPHTLLMCGDDDEAKSTVSRWLADDFGWRDILDLGDITQARGMEAYLLLWVRLYGAIGHDRFNIHISRA